MKKCDEQVKIVDEQARRVGMEGIKPRRTQRARRMRFCSKRKMRADFLNRKIRLRKNNSGGTKQNRSGAEKDCLWQPEG
jgi:hypothetical protein